MGICAMLHLGDIKGSQIEVLEVSVRISASVHWMNCIDLNITRVWQKHAWATSLVGWEVLEIVQTEFQCLVKFQKIVKASTILEQQFPFPFLSKLWYLEYCTAQEDLCTLPDWYLLEKGSESQLVWLLRIFWVSCEKPHAAPAGFISETFLSSFVSLIHGANIQRAIICSLTIWMMMRWKSWEHICVAIKLLRNWTFR